MDMSISGIHALRNKVTRIPRWTCQGYHGSCLSDFIVKGVAAKPVLHLEKTDPNLKSKRRRLSRISSSATQDSVTSCLFLPGTTHFLAVSLAPTGQIYLWDIRSAPKGHSPYAIFPHGEAHSSRHGKQVALHP